MVDIKSKLFESGSKILHWKGLHWKDLQRKGSEKADSIYDYSEKKSGILVTPANKIKSDVKPKIQRNKIVCENFHFRDWSAMPCSRKRQIFLTC